MATTGHRAEDVAAVAATRSRTSRAGLYLLGLALVAVLAGLGGGIARWIRSCGPRTD